MLTFLLYALCGYVLAVIFPVPIVSQTILDLWKKLGAYVAERKAAVNR